MLKLIKYLKNSIVPIIVIVGLLIVQAVCDLALPDYTSNIVNVGIQQGGVENAVPEVIREGEMNKILLFVKDEDKKVIMDNYILINKNDKENQQEYPILKEESVYKLNTENKDVIRNLNNIFAKPIVIVAGIEKGDFKDKIEIPQQPQQEQIPEGMEIPESMEIPEGMEMPQESVDMKDMDPFEIFKMMPKEEFDKIKVEIDKKFNEMPDSLLQQATAPYIKDEYVKIGIDTENLQSNYILLTGVKMVLIALVSMVATVMVGFIGAKVAASLGRDLRGKVFKKVVSFSNNELDKFSTASLITRSTNDIQQIQMLMVMLLRVVFYAPILGLGGFLKVLQTDTSMAWIIGVAVLTILSIVMLLFGFVMPKFKIVQKLVDKVNLVTREILTGMLVIRAFGTEKHEEKRFDNANMDLTKTNLFVNRAMALMMPTMMLVMNGITILIVWNGSHAVDTGSMQVGDMMAFIQYTMQIIMSFLMISMVSIMLPRATVSAQRIDEVLTTDLVINDPEVKKEFEDTHKGYIEFRNVCFRYPNAEEDVLSNLTFTAKPGQTTAFIGSTGSGKSTLINLIPRFYDVTSGEILIDGVNIKDVSQYDLREKIGYVPQKGVLFSGSIESNIKYGNDSISKEDVIKAAEISQSIEFINSKTEGFNEEISQGGTNVSGGQKQRLSIARAIAKNPNIYIFDDSFSALDFKTDAALRRALKDSTADSTVLIVAQRISTILHADEIVVLDEGKIVGIGTHQELLKNCEVYKEIALSQLSKEELDNE